MTRPTQMFILALTAIVGVVSVAEAEFLGLIKDLTVTEFSGGMPAYVTRIYARFSCPENRVLAVEEADISSAAQLYQNPFGSATEPSPVLISVFPDLAFDTFVTIGLLEQGPPGTSLTALSPGTSMTTGGCTGGWHTDPDAPQTLGQPTPEAGVGDYFVLLAQFTIGDEGLFPTVCIEGTMTVRWLAGDGQEVESTEELSCPLQGWSSDADLNDDGIVNGVDLAIMLGNWGLCRDCPCSVPGDLFINCWIEGIDLATLLSLWRPESDCAEPPAALADPARSIMPQRDDGVLAAGDDRGIKTEGNANQGRDRE